MADKEYFVLEGGDRMAKIGFGTWQVSSNLCMYMYPIHYLHYPNNTYTFPQTILYYVTLI
jgi:hypothetical protein